MKKYVKSAIMPFSEESIAALISIATEADSEEVLQELVNTSNLSWVVKLAIIENPNVTKEILDQLCRDNNSTVCKSAKYRVQEVK